MKLLVVSWKKVLHKIVWLYVFIDFSLSNSFRLFFFSSKAYLPNGTEMQNLNVFRCYTCKAQSPRYFVEDLAEQIVYV